MAGRLSVKSIPLTARLFAGLVKVKVKVAVPPTAMPDDGVKALVKMGLCLTVKH